jgi:hypothetical protein
MAFTFPTSANQLQAFAGALYGVQIGSVTMAQVTSDIAAVGGLDIALNNYFASSFSGVPTASVAASMASNLGLTGALLTEGTAYIAAQLNAAAPGARGVVLPAPRQQGLRAELQRLLHTVDQRVVREGLLDEIKSAALDRRHRVGHIVHLALDARRLVGLRPHRLG